MNGISVTRVHGSQSRTERKRYWLIKGWLVCLPSMLPAPPVLGAFQYTGEMHSSGWCEERKRFYLYVCICLHYKKVTCVLSHPLIVIGKISNKLHLSALLSNTPFLSKSKSILPYSSKYIGRYSVCFFCKRPKENKSICSVHVFKCIHIALCCFKNSAVFVTVFSILLLILLGLEGAENRKES